MSQVNYQKLGAEAAARFHASVTPTTPTPPAPEPEAPGSQLALAKRSAAIMREMRAKGETGDRAYAEAMKQVYLALGEAPAESGAVSDDDRLLEIMDTRFPPGRAAFRDGSVPPFMQHQETGGKVSQVRLADLMAETYPKDGWVRVDE